MLPPTRRARDFCRPAQDKAAPTRRARRDATSLLHSIARQPFAPLPFVRSAHMLGRARLANRNRHLDRTLVEIPRSLLSSRLWLAECGPDNNARGKRAERPRGFVWRL